MQVGIKEHRVGKAGQEVTIGDSMQRMPPDGRGLQAATCRVNPPVLIAVGRLAYRYGTAEPVGPATSSKRGTCSVPLSNA